MAHPLITDAAAFDLDAYFERIGYRGRRAATLDVLRELHLRHAQSIPFENLNPLLRWPVRLDTGSLVRKLVHDRRGGYCFEQNLLFAHALDALGFRVRGHAARVVYNSPPGTITPRGHMLLAVEAEGATFIADVGFGGLTLTGPLALVADLQQATPHEPFRLAAAGEGYQMEARVRDTWTPLYRFTLDPAYLADYEMASWYLCNFPGSHFTTGLIAARPAPDRRYTLRGSVLTTHLLSGGTERRVLTTAAALRAALENTLGLQVPQLPEVDATLERISAADVPAGVRAE